MNQLTDKEQLTRYLSYLEQDTENTHLLLEISKLHFALDDLSAASEHLNQAIKIKPNPEALLLMARILYQQNKIEDALELVQDILQQAPDHAEALGLLALLYFDCNDEERARETSKKALELASDNYDAKVIDILLNLHTEERSMTEVEALIHDHPEDCRLWFALGNLYLGQGNATFAEQCFKKATTLYPEFYDAFIVLAWSQLLNNQLQDAENTYQIASQKCDKFADAYGGLALIKLLQEEFAAAKELIDKAMLLNPDCFLAQITHSIYLSYQDPKKGNTQLLKTLKDCEIPICNKLVYFIEEFNGTSS